MNKYVKCTHTWKEFAVRYKILLDTDLKLILLSYSNNLCRNLKYDWQCCKTF